MRNQNQLFLGGLLVLIGAVFLFGTLFNINPWTFCWPIGLILLGVWLLWGPRTFTGVWLLGDIRRDGAWKVANEEIGIGVGDVKLDFTQADIPVGETRIRVSGFVGDVDMWVPANIGVAVTSNGFVVDAKIFGQKQGQLLTPLHFTSDNYVGAERKILLETNFFVGDITVKQR